MKYLLIPLAALGVGTAALAQDAPAAKAPDSYPLCSSTVTDECMNPSQAPHHATAKGHATAHHRHHAAQRETGKKK